MTTSNGLYIHIPFCRKKCRYCDFLSFTDAECSDRYIDALTDEIGGFKADTVFIGGGTPSVLQPRQIEKIIDSADIDEDAEITIEGNPESLTKDKLKAYKSMGINRLSIGFQSLDDNILMLLGRIHSAKEAVKAYDNARDAGFENINIDLMFAIPGQSVEILDKTVREVLAMEPEHISAYSLQIEEGTPFYGMFEPVPEEEDRNMYHRIIDTLAIYGYGQYEVSNFAKAGYECRHNLKYWSMEDYKGAGLGASSFLDGKRIVNTGNMEEYLNGSIVKEVHNNTFEDNASEYVFTGMRKTAGITYDGFKNYLNEDFFDVFKGIDEKIERWVSLGLMEADERGMRFTTKGMDIENSILAEFIL